MKVKMLRQPRGKFNNKPFPAAGEVFDVEDEGVAGALVKFNYAEPVEDESPDEKPAEDETPDTANERETATADERETRDGAPAEKPAEDSDKPAAKRGPGRPRKNQG